MKWVKVAIGAVIAIAVVPMIALSVFNLTQGQLGEEVVTFEVLTLSDGIGTTDIDVYNLINNYGVFENDTTINVTSVKNNNNNGSTFISIYTDYYTLNGGDTDIVIRPNNVIEDDGSPTPLQVGDIWVITFEVTTPPVLSGITATLLLLAPVIFVSGVLYFIYNNKQEGI